MIVMTRGFEGQNREHPIWEGAVVGFLYAAENSLIAREKVLPTMGQICVELVRSDMLDNFGDLQKYLRKRDAVVQLLAQEFKPEARPGYGCVDVRTGEPKKHWLMISAGRDEIIHQFYVLGVSHEVNETTLRKSTGMLASQNR